MTSARDRRSLCVVAAVAVAGALGGGAVPAAHAAEATLWGCHGPAGQPLGTAPLLASAAGDGVATTFASGCAATAATLDDGGLRAAFTRADPSSGSAAAWQAELPAGVPVSRVALTRRTSGFGGAPVPDGGQRYVAETADGPLESSSVQDATNAPLDGTAVFATTGGGAVRLGLSCGSTGSGRCAAPSEAPLAIEVGAVAVTVDDDEAPRGAVGGIVSPASGTMTLTVRATDAGLGLARAEASVDGVVVASAAVGGAGCADLSPGDPAVDLPLGGGCPASVTDLELAVPTPAITDGPHQLRVTATDAAGNAAVLADQPFVIANTPPERQSSAVLTLGTGGAPGSPGGAGAGLGGLVNGAGGVTSGPGIACAAPRLSMFLKDKPLRVSKGVPVLRSNGRYRYSGTLTCAVRGRRVHAPAGLTVALRNQIGKRTHRKSGLTTRADGGVTAILAYPTSRVLDFRYTSGDRTTTRVRIRIAVTKPKAKTKSTKRKAR